MEKVHAGKLMERYVQSGQYQQLNQAKHRVNVIKEGFRTHLDSSEERRHVFPKFNLVAKFVPKNVYQVDHVALNEYLYNKGLLLPCVEVDTAQLKEQGDMMELLEGFQLPRTYFVKASHNKIGKEKVATIPYDVEGLPIEKLGLLLTLHSRNLQAAEYEYTKLKDVLLNCPILKEKKKLSHAYGSVSRVANKATYDIGRIANVFGDEFLIQHGRASMKKIDRYIEKGTISKSEVDQFRKVMDIRLDFMVMSLDTEAKMYEFFQNKINRAAELQTGTYSLF
jgi:hypothetical protein